MLQDLLAEGICVGWMEARYAFAPPTVKKGDGGYEGPTSKEERGKMQAKVLREIREKLEEE